MCDKGQQKTNVCAYIFLSKASHYWASQGEKLNENEYKIKINYFSSKILLTVFYYNCIQARRHVDTAVAHCPSAFFVNLSAIKFFKVHFFYWRNNFFFL